MRRATVTPARADPAPQVGGRYRRGADSAEGRWALNRSAGRWALMAAWEADHCCPVPARHGRGHQHPNRARDRWHRRADRCSRVEAALPPPPPGLGAGPPRLGAEPPWAPGPWAGDESEGPPGPLGAAFDEPPPGPLEPSSNPPKPPAPPPPPPTTAAAARRRAAAAGDAATATATAAAGAAAAPTAAAPPPAVSNDVENPESKGASDWGSALATPALDPRRVKPRQPAAAKHANCWVLESRFLARGGASRSPTGLHVRDVKRAVCDASGKTLPCSYRRATMLDRGRAMAAWNPLRRFSEWAVRGTGCAEVSVEVPAQWAPGMHAGFRVRPTARRARGSSKSVAGESMRLPWLRISAGSCVPNSGSNAQRGQYPATSAGWRSFGAAVSMAGVSQERTSLPELRSASTVINKIHA